MTTQENNSDRCSREQEPEIVLRRFDEDDAEMIEEILNNGGVKSEVIRRA